MTNTNQPNRRDFIKAAGSVAAASLLAGNSVNAAATPRRYALVGTGDRGTSMWGRQLVERYPDLLQFVGLCDINPKRVVAAKGLIGVNCPTFTNFDEMLTNTKPELVMVTTVDGFHVDYITRALERGFDVMTEKPMTIDEHQCQRVLDAEKKSGRKIIVTFNYRYAPKAQKIKELLLSGEIGKVLSVDFSWYLDVSHGADYFRRWHRLKNPSTRVRHCLSTGCFAASAVLRASTCQPETDVSLGSAASGVYRQPPSRCWPRSMNWTAFASASA